MVSLKSVNFQPNITSMKTHIYYLLIIAVLFSCANGTKKSTFASELNTSETNNKKTTFYLVRHAEKDLTVAQDPELTAEGIKRAKNLATHLNNINAVYATPYKRTEATASFTAKANNISIQTYQPNNLFNQSFLKKHKGQRILIVGHSNTIPQLVNKMTGSNELEDIPDDIYNRVYKVVFSGEKATATMEIVD